MKPITTMPMSKAGPLKRDVPSKGFLSEFTPALPGTRITKPLFTCGVSSFNLNAAAVDLLTRPFTDKIGAYFDLADGKKLFCLSNEIPLGKDEKGKEISLEITIQQKGSGLSLSRNKIKGLLALFSEDQEVYKTKFLGNRYLVTFRREGSIEGLIIDLANPLPKAPVTTHV